MDDLVLRVRDRVLSAPCRDHLGFEIPRCAPAETSAVEDAERRIRARIPPLLVRLYLEVANGGFGPGYGLMGVRGGHTDDLGRDIAAACEGFRLADPEAPGWRWPDGHVPICHWGCGVYTFADFTHAAAPVAFVEPGAMEPDDVTEDVIWGHGPSLDAWLTDWLDGKDQWK